MKRTSPTIEAAAFRLLVVRRFGVLSGGDDSSVREITVSLFYVLEKGVKLRSWHLLHFQSIWAFFTSMHFDSLLISIYSGV